MAPEILVQESILKSAGIEQLKSLDVWALVMTFFVILNPDQKNPFQYDLEKRRTSDAGLNVSDVLLYFSSCRVLGPHRILGPCRFLGHPRVLGSGSSHGPGSRFSGMPSNSYLQIFYISNYDVMLKRNKFLWILFLSKSFGEKFKHTELALHFIQKQYFS